MADPGPPVSGVQVQLTARVETDAAFAELGRAWLVGARERLAGELWHRLEAGVPSVVGGVLRSGVPSLGERGESTYWMIDDLENDDSERCSSADCGLQADEHWEGRVA